MDAEAAAELFEQHRSHLLGVAYRVLGSLADAEDAVQECYLRLTRVELSTLREPRAWLTTTVGRICLDSLGSARARREQYVGPWLPEPVVRAAVAPAVGPEDRVTLDESVSMAMLVVLESLSPAERTSFVLHDVLGLDYGEVAAVVGRGEGACRQLVSRARGHLRQRPTRFSPDPTEHTGAVRAFAHACQQGDVEALLRVLDPQVVLRSDGGGLVPGIARRPVSGAEPVARLLLGAQQRHPDWVATAATVNGSTGLLFREAGRVVGVMGFAVAEGAVHEIFFVLNPDKLRRVEIS